MVQIIWVLWEFHCICDLPFSQWLENFLPWTNNHFLAVPDLNPVTPSVYGFCPLNQQLFSVKVYQSCQCLFLVVNFRKIGPETWKISMFHIMFLFIYQVMIFFLWDVTLEDDYPLENERCKSTIQELCLSKRYYC